MIVARPPKRKLPRKAFIGLVVVILAILGVLLLHRHVDEQNSASSVASNFDKSQHSINQASSIWVVVNKKHALNPVNYVPGDLVMPNVPLRAPDNDSMQMRSEAATSLQQMFAAAKSVGINLMISSAYRSFAYQTNLYDDYVKSQGQNMADQTSARPGYSEHQTGLAADLEPVSRNCEIDPCFASTTEAKWLAANAYLYGFILRYPVDKVMVTGYAYEPWHFRYVGTALAGAMHAQHVKTLEEFFKVSGGLSY